MKFVFLGGAAEVGISMGKGSKSDGDGDGISLTCGRWIERSESSKVRWRWEEERGATSMAYGGIASLGKVIAGACLNGERQGCQETPSRFISWPWFQVNRVP